MANPMVENTFEGRTQTVHDLLAVNRWFFALFLMVTDYLAIVAGLMTAIMIRVDFLPRFGGFQKPFHIEKSLVFFLIPLVYLLLLCYEGLYRKRPQFWQRAQALFKATAFATVIIIGLLYFIHRSETVSRTFVLTGWGFVFLTLILSRYLTRKVLIAVGVWQRPVVIVGLGESAERVARVFESESFMGYKIVGLINEGGSEQGLNGRYPRIGHLDQVEKAILENGIREVVIAAADLDQEKLSELIDRIQPYVNNLTLAPDLVGVPMGSLELETLLEQNIVLLRARNNLLQIGNLVVKRLFDIVLGLLAAACSLPVMALLALLIRLDSPGPVFYISKRIGMNGKLFNCYKFRTMFLDGDARLEALLARDAEAKEEWERFFKLKRKDPRVTRVGKWLRKHSFDELPQVINVLKGEMSLVGPRPYLPRERDTMGTHARTIVVAPPGITGLWQVSGRNEIDFHGRLIMDAWYVRNWSFWLDMMIIFKTVLVVLKRDGAY